MPSRFDSFFQASLGVVQQLSPTCISSASLARILEEHHVTRDQLASANMPSEIRPRRHDCFDQPVHLPLPPRWLPDVGRVRTLREEVEVHVDEDSA